MENFIAVLINGMTTGTTYALIVLGVTLLILVRKIFHFGYAYIIIMTTYLGWIILGLTNDNMFISLPAFIIIGTILVLVSEFLFRPLAKKGAFLESVVLGQGLAIFLTDICSHFINHGFAISFPRNMAGSGIGIRSGLIFFKLGNIYALAIGIIVVFLLMLFLYRSRRGLAVRAMAQNQDVATSFGISFTRTGLIGFGIAGILAGVVALLLAMVMNSVDPSLGDTLASKVMVIALFAGMGNLMGGLICGLMMGIIEALALVYVPGSWTDVVTFSLLMVVILLRPKGVFGTRT
jgi:branched-chain amino acid transport system permease protein